MWVGVAEGERFLRSFTLTGDFYDKMDFPYSVLSLSLNE